MLRLGHTDCSWIGVGSLAYVSNLNARQNLASRMIAGGPEVRVRVKGERQRIADHRQSVQEFGSPWGKVTVHSYVCQTWIRLPVSRIEAGRS